MDTNLIVASAFALGLLVGALTVFLLQRRAGSASRELAAELEETREELEANREEVARHFAQTSDLFRSLTEQYTLLYAHLADGAREFCTDEIPALGRGLETSPLALAPDEPEAAAEAEASPPQQTNGGNRVAAAG
jgi:uncharacterized membrane-anchored protein YhcB (DUF1043 family)